MNSRRSWIGRHLLSPRQMPFPAPCCDFYCLFSSPFPGLLTCTRVLSLSLLLTPRTPASLCFCRPPSSAALMLEISQAAPSVPLSPGLPDFSASWFSPWVWISDFWDWRVCLVQSGPGLSNHPRWVSVGHMVQGCGGPVSLRRGMGSKAEGDVFVTDWNQVGKPQSFPRRGQGLPCHLLVLLLISPQSSHTQWRLLEDFSVHWPHSGIITTILAVAPFVPWEHNLGTFD